MKVTITPSKLCGTLDAIASKSYAHRIIIASALSDKETIIHIRGRSEDIYATIEAVKALGADVKDNGDTLLVTPIKKQNTPPVIPVGESGTTARMILPIASALYEKGKIEGRGSLLKRPFAALCDTMSEHNVRFSSDFLPISFNGMLTPGEYKITGSQSSQFISALMYALPMLNGNSIITLTSPLASSGYVDMTREVLQKFGISGTFKTSGNEKFISPGEIKVEGDMSNAAFFLACGIKIKGLNPNSLQKDKLFTHVKDNAEIDASDIPDLVPILCVYAASKTSQTRIYNAERLRIKESDRIETTKAMIEALGGEIKTTDSELIINGNGHLLGGTVDSFNDHRIVMSAAIASCICKNKVIINNAQAVNKSYPNFFTDFNSLGGKAYVE